METIEIRVSEGTATLAATQGQSLGVADIDRAVKSAGFTPRGVTATAVGMVSKRGETHLLRWKDVEIELVDGDGSVPTEGQRVRVTGPLTVDRDGTAASLAITVNAVEGLER